MSESVKEPESVRALLERINPPRQYNVNTLEGEQTEGLGYVPVERLKPAKAKIKRKVTRKITASRTSDQSSQATMQTINHSSKAETDAWHEKFGSAAQRLRKPK